MIRSLLYFVAGFFGGWLAILAISWGKWGVRGLIAAGVNGAICLIPTWFSFTLSIWCIDRPRVEQLTATVVGWAMRSLVALGLGLTVYLTIPYFRESGQELIYWTTLLALYVLSLIFETLLTAWCKRHAADG